jgi:hypothetical protein
MATRIIGTFAGAAINDDIVCLEHAVDGDAITTKDFPDGFICDYCGKAVA